MEFFKWINFLGDKISLVFNFSAKIGVKFNLCENLVGKISEKQGKYLRNIVLETISKAFKLILLAQYRQKFITNQNIDEIPKFYPRKNCYPFRTCGLT